MIQQQSNTLYQYMRNVKESQKHYAKKKQMQKDYLLYVLV